MSNGKCVTINQKEMTDLMTAEEIHTKLQEGYDDLQAGKLSRGCMHGLC